MDPGPPAPPELLLAAPPPPPPAPPIRPATASVAPAGTVVVDGRPQFWVSVQVDSSERTWGPKENWSPGTGGLIPDGVETVTSTVPVPAGDVAVTEVPLSTVIVPGTPPKSTAVAPLRFVPVTVTLVPPPTGPVAGLTAVTAGGGTTTV